MARVARVGNGWRVEWREGGREGKRQNTPTFSTEQEADEACERVNERMRSMKAARTGVVLTIGEIASRWQAAKIAEGNDPLWAVRYAKANRGMAKIRKWSTVLDITPEAVARWRQDGGSPGSGATFRAMLWWAKDFLDQPVRDQTLLALRRPRHRRKPKKPLIATTTVSAWLKQARDISPDSEALLHCLATYGWRPITASRLLVGDVNRKLGTIRTRVKGGDVIEHPLQPSTLRLLRPILDARKPDEPLFLDPRTGRAFGPMGASSAHQWFRDWFTRDKDGNVLGGIYDLKRYAISNALARGMVAQDVALFTGHRTIGQVNGYARTNETTARRVLPLLGHRGARGSGKPPRPPASKSKRNGKTKASPQPPPLRLAGISS